MKSKTQFKQLLLLLLVFTFSARITFGQNCGDINADGSTDIVDALLVAQCYVSLISCPSAEIGDVNCDGSIDIIDGLLIAQLYVGLINTLTCCDTPTDPPEITPDPNVTPVPGNYDEPHGYARGTTGGGNASPVTVTSASAFKSAVDGSNSAVIIVKGKLSGGFTIGSNKTIIGADSSSGLGGTVSVKSNNVIFKNLIIGPAGGDAMEISGASNIFLHKVTLIDGGDGSCDIVRAADNVTLSWCRFYYTTSSDHRFPVLIGNSDSATGDRGKLHVTIHHTWFDDGCIERLPRVRFGTVHLYNNYYSSNTNNYCIGLGKECHVRVENSVFEDQNQLWFDWGGKDSGVFGWSNLKLEGSSTLPDWMPNSFPVFTPPYSFSLDSVDSVKSIVSAGAGNVF